MNERIKELAEQASKEAFPLVSMAWMEKFAELIVAECADIATINAHQWASPGTYILKHFGVKND